MTGASRRRLWFWIVVGLLVAAAVAFALWPRPVAVDLAVVEDGPMRVTIDHEGRTRVRDRYVVSAPVAGRVLRIELEPGDEVKAGRTVVATFLPETAPLLDVRTRTELAARVKAAEAALSGARAERDRVRTEAEHAQSESERARKLESQGLLTEQAVRAAETDAAARARTAAAAESAVAAASHELEAARAFLMRPQATPGAAASSQALSLRAPSDGVVLRRLRESESFVPHGEPLLEIGDIGSLEVVADFLSADAVKMRPGQPALIDQWGGPPLNGHVQRVEPAGFMKVSALGVEEQRVWVIIDVDDPHAAWLPLGDGYRVEARVVVWEKPKAVQVPPGALFRRGEGWALFAVDGGRAAVRDVKAGQSSADAAEILSGVRPGETVIVHPPDTVVEGTKVEGRAAEAASR